MSASNLVRLGGLAAIVGGALFVAAELLGLPTLNEETFSETVPGSGSPEAPFAGSS